MICFRPDNSCWCAFSNVDHLCVFSNYKALIIVFCIVSGNSFDTIYRYLMWLCLCLFFGNTSIPLSLCQYLYTSSIAISLSLLNDNISMPLLWQYIYASSMAMSICLFYDNTSYFSSMAIYHCCYEQYPSASSKNFLFASVSNLLWKYLCFCDQCILLLRAISLCLCKQCLYISLLLRAISLCFSEQYYSTTFFCMCQSFYLSVVFFLN